LAKFRVLYCQQIWGLLFGLGGNGPHSFEGASCLPTQISDRETIAL
jgi:hypothetical protein